MLSIVSPKIINEETKRTTQPEHIETKLKEHQLAMIYEMRNLETPTRKNLIHCVKFPVSLTVIKLS